MQQTKGKLFLDRYEVIKELGSGGFSKVYKAFDTKMERNVAIKAIPSSSKATAWAKREAQTSARLNHPGIATIFEYEETDNNHYLIMEYLEGITLREVLDNLKVLRVDQAVAIASEVCIALEYAHLNFVVHRDIKPGNIMILKDGSVKITDFGTARLMSQVSKENKTVATPAYMSPEQVKRGHDDDRTDQFSLGIVLYEMLTGQNPFEAGSTNASLFKVINFNPPAPSEFNKKINKSLDDVCLKVLEKDLNERFATITDFRYKIERSAGSQLSNKQIIKELYNKLHGEAIDKAVPEFVTSSRGLLSRLFSNQSLNTRFLSGIIPAAFVLLNTTNVPLPVRVGMALSLLVAGLVSPLLSAVLLIGLIIFKFFAASPLYGIIALVVGGIYIYYYAVKKPFEAVFPLNAFIFAKAGSVLLFPLLTGFFFGPLTTAFITIVGLSAYGLSQMIAGKDILFLNSSSFISLALQVGFLTLVSVAISILAGGRNAKRDVFVVFGSLVALVVFFIMPQWKMLNIKVDFPYLMQNISLSLIIAIALMLFVPIESLKKKGL